MVVGVLALQGDFVEHESILKSLSVRTKQVRTIDDLTRVESLVLPGGESTTQSLLMAQEGLLKAVSSRNRAGTLPLLGTCAGAILLANEVTGKNVPHTLELLDITIDRNAYGTHMQSFEADVSTVDSTMHASFIRAPQITRVGPDVEIVARYKDDPVAVRCGDIFASTFHTEVHAEPWLHQLFLESADVTLRDAPNVSS